MCLKFQTIRYIHAHSDNRTDDSIIQNRISTRQLAGTNFYVFVTGTKNMSAMHRSNVGNSYPIIGLDRSLGLQKIQAPRLQENRHTKVVRLLALDTDRLYPPGNIHSTHFC